MVAGTLPEAPSAPDIEPEVLIIGLEALRLLIRRHHVWHNRLPDDDLAVAERNINRRVADALEYNFSDIDVLGALFSDMWYNRYACGCAACNAKADRLRGCECRLCSFRASYLLDRMPRENSGLRESEREATPSDLTGIHDAQLYIPGEGDDDDYLG